MKLTLAIPAASLIAALAACSSMDESPSTSLNAAPTSSTADTTVANGNPLPGAPQRDGVENPGDSVDGVDTPPDTVSDGQPQ